MKKNTEKITEKIVEKQNEVAEQPTRKQLALNVDKAVEALDEAYAQYNQAKQKADELTEKYKKDLAAILDPAKDAVRKAEQDKCNAICEFNKSYGVYTRTYTGAVARNEFLKAIDEIENNFWNHFFNF